MRCLGLKVRGLNSWLVLISSVFKQIFTVPRWSGHNAWHYLKQTKINSQRPLVMILKSSCFFKFLNLILSTFSLSWETWTELTFNSKLVILFYKVNKWQGNYRAMTSWHWQVTQPLLKTYCLHYLQCLSRVQHKTSVTVVL